MKVITVDAKADNNGVRLHYLDARSPSDPGYAPLVYVPGMLGQAEDFRTSISYFSPRRCIALTLRGRGQSDAPESGYSFEGHVADIRAVIEDAGVHQFYLMAFSIGVPMALGYAVHHSVNLTGLIVLDYPARYPSIPPEWAESVKERSDLTVHPYVVDALQRESREVVLWDELERVQCPALVLRGGKPGSLLSEEGAEMYRKHLVNCVVSVFDESSHALWEPDFQAYVSALRTFLDEHERR